MQGSGPTILITPTSADPGSGGGVLAWAMGSVMIWVLVVMVIGVVLALAHRRRRRVDPRELAFRSITRQLGLSRGQIDKVRKHAATMGFASPVGVVMSRELMAKALED